MDIKFTTVLLTDDRFDTREESFDNFEYAWFNFIDSFFYITKTFPNDKQIADFKKGKKIHYRGSENFTWYLKIEKFN